MSESYPTYQLVGGQAVTIKPLTVTEITTYFADEGSAFNPVICDVSGAMEEKSVEITKNETKTVEPSEGKAGLSEVTVTVAVPPYMTVLTAPYEANDGSFVCIATDSESNTVVGVCVVSDGEVIDSYGDGTFAIDSTGETPVLEWTPSVTAEIVTAWYAASVN